MKKRKEGLISVVVPIYNASLYIEECLNGLLSQTYKNMEVILVNDASTDNTKWNVNTKLDNLYKDLFLNSTGDK
ncbi:glycosyltransferase family 2 protein [Ureibacillus chungkukjangi]|uniref:glycosyltransferase family 2 protein n=1 Tax=Ureibacillus chungkukjangi TaxID=1202712 RepID=UPI00384C4C7F